MPAHTFSSGAAIACSIPSMQLVGCCLRPALQPSGCLLLTQNGVPSLLILLFEIKRSRKVWDQVSKAAASPWCIWMSRTALKRVLYGLAHCCVEGSSFSQCLDKPIWPSFSVFQEFLCSNNDCLSSRNPLFVNNNHGINEAHKHAFHSCLGHVCFLWPWWSLWTPLQMLMFGLWIILEKPTLFTSDNLVHYLWVSFHLLQQISTRNHASRRCPVRFLGTILAQILLIPNSSVSIKQMVSWFMFTSSLIILTVNLQSDRTISLTRAVSLPVHVDYGVRRADHLQRGFCLQKTFCASKRLVLVIAWSPKVCWSFPCVVVAMSPGLTQKRWHITAWYSVLPFPWQGSQTCPDTSSTYSTLRHCKAMPLQVGMEEGPRPKAVCWC